MAEAIQQYWQEYIFNSAQLGFQIVQWLTSNSQPHIQCTKVGIPWNPGPEGVLGLGFKEKLVEVLSKRLSNNIVKMVNNMLQEMKIRTSNEIWETKGTVERDVYLGLLLAPTLFKVYLKYRHGRKTDGRTGPSRESILWYSLLKL